MEAWFAAQQTILFDRRQHGLAGVLLDHNSLAIHSVLLSHRWLFWNDQSASKGRRKLFLEILHHDFFECMTRAHQRIFEKLRISAIRFYAFDWALYFRIYETLISFPVIQVSLWTASRTTSSSRREQAPSLPPVLIILIVLQAFFEN